MGLEHNRDEIATDALIDSNPEILGGGGLCLPEPELRFEFCWSIWKRVID